MQAQFYDFRANWQKMELWQGDEQIPIKPKAMELLRFLFDNRERVVSKDEVFDAVWRGRIVTESALTTALNDLRKALQDTGKTSRIIRTVYGRGLQFVAEVDTDGASAPDVPARQRSEARQTARPKDDGPRVLAIMPFEHFADDPQETRFAVFLTRELVTRFSVYRDFRVLSPKPHKESDPQASDTVAHYSISGRALMTPAETVVTVHLSDAVTGAHIWADRYALPANGALAVAGDTAATVVGSVVPTITTYEYRRDREVPMTELSAIGCLYRGRYMLRSNTAAAQEEAIALFAQSIARDPTSGAAYASLASALCNQADMSGDEDQRMRLFDRARTAAFQATELEPDLSPGWYALAQCHIAANELEEAVHAADVAVRLNELSIRAQYSLGFALMCSGQAERAVSVFDAALRVGATDPKRGAVMANRALALVMLGRHDEAIDWSRKAQTAYDPVPNAFIGEICALVHLDRQGDVSDAFDRARTAYPNFGAGMLPSLFSLRSEVVRRQIVEAFSQAEHVWQAA